MLAAAVETIRDLGTPSVIGAVVGALIAHYTAKARSREEHERSLEVLRRRDERAEAREVLTALREIHDGIAGVSSLEALGKEFEALRKDWWDRVHVPARLVISDVLYGRVCAASYVFFLASIAREVPVPYALYISISDVETALVAWLRDEAAPEARLPSETEIQQMFQMFGPDQWIAASDRLKKWLMTLEKH